MRVSFQSGWSFFIHLLACAFLSVGHVRQANAQSLHTSRSVFEEVGFQGFESQTHWAFRHGDEMLKVAAADIVRWGAWSGIGRYPSVWLSDGSWVSGSLEFPVGRVVEVNSDWLACPPLPVAVMRGMVLNPPASLSKWLELYALMEAVEGDQDVVWLLNGRRLSGILRWPDSDIDPLSGQFQLDAGGQLVDLPLANIQAIVFSPSLVGGVPQQAAGWELGLEDGSLLRVSQLSMDAATLTFDLACSIKLESLDHPTEFATPVNYLAGMPAGLRFFSQMEPASYRHLPDSKLNWELGRNRDLAGRHLTTRGGIVANGLTMHSTSQVAYRWDGSPARLLAEVCFARPLTQGRESFAEVKCQVLVARSGQLQPLIDFRLSQSEQMLRKLVDLDVSGAQLIVLIAEAADFAQYGDHVQWLDVRLVPSENKPR